MRQVVAQLISDTLLDWRDGESRILVELPLPLLTHDLYKELIKTWENQNAKKIEGIYLGCRIVFIAKDRDWELASMVHTILLALRGTAYSENSDFDYIETQRIKAPTPQDEAIIIEIMETQPKREIWVQI